MKNITLNFIIKEATEQRKGKTVIKRTPDGEPDYLQHDAIGLLSLFMKFDTRLHTPNEWKNQMRLEDKIREVYIANSRNTQPIELSIDEASFLKSYLKEFDQKEGKNQAIAPFERRTYFSVIEQFE